MGEVLESSGCYQEVRIHMRSHKEKGGKRKFHVSTLIPSHKLLKCLNNLHMLILISDNHAVLEK